MDIIIACTPRTGSTLLMYSLATHPQAVCGGELYATDVSRGESDHFANKSDGRCNLWKVMYPDEISPSSDPTLVEKRESLVVYLYREDRARQLLSWKIASQTGCWRNGMRSYPTAFPEDAEGQIQRAEVMYAKDAICVSYEHLVANWEEVICRILAAAGWDIIPIAMATRVEDIDKTIPANKFIASVVNGRTFADVGGLFGVVNERVSVAHAWGATEVTMLDACPVGFGWWESFHDRMERLGVSEYQSAIHDISKDWPLSYDVVHCGGVIYHHPNPMQVLAGLRKITKEYLVFTSAIMQHRIENQFGTFEVPPSNVVFVPALSNADREILAEYWKPFLSGNRLIGITEASDFSFTDFAPCWWMPTAESIESMCNVAGFKVLDKELTWGGNALTLFLTKR